ncbi:hypothetical protein, partial [Thiocapsa sp. N5-Cardenillas]|uniref:hypothetical protein n=1 Tax=Thiocapsa sp. N5-Cardenillas TaxID=3137397 RepID=UPI0035B15A92
NNVFNGVVVMLGNAAVYDYGNDYNKSISMTGTSSLTADTITAGTITMSDTATINANSTIVKTLTVGATATLNTSWLVRPSGTMPGDLTTVQAIHDELVCPAILDGASSIPGGTEYSFTITEMKTLGVYDSDMEVLYHGFPMDITEIADLKSHDQLQTIIYYNGGFMCYEGGEWVITYTVTGADRTAWETRDGFALMGFDANKTGDMIEFYAVYETAGNVPYQFQFKDASTYNVFTQPYYYKLHNTTMSGIGTTVYYHWWSAVSPGNIMIRGYDGTSAYELDRSYATAFYLGSSVVTWFIDSIVPIIDGHYYATDLRLAGQSASLFNVYISQTDIVYQKSGVNVTIPNSHITYRTGELTAYVKNANFTSYTVTASNLTTVTATHGGDIPMGFLTVTESYMFYSHNTFMVFTDEGVLIRAAQLPGVNVAVGEDTVLVFEGNYRYLTVTYGDAYLINFGKSMTLIAPNGTVTIYHFTEAFSINTIRVFDDMNASGYYINGVIYLETEFVDGGDLYISTLYDFGYSLYDTSDTEFFDTSYLKLSGNLVSSAVSAFAESEFAALTVVVGQFQSGRIFVTVGDLVLDVRRDGLNYRFTMDGNEIMIRSANQDFIITVVREYEGYTMTVIPARVIGSDYTQIAPERTLQWVDTGSHVASSVAITYSSAEVRIYSIVVRTQSTIQTLPDRILTNQSNIITGDGLTLNVSFWGIGTVLTFGQYTITRTATNVLTVNDTVNNVTTTVPYAHTLSVLWEDAFEVNGRVISANATAPDTVNVNGYLRFSSATETDVTYVTEQVLRVGEEMSFDISQYAVYVLFLSLMSIALIGYFATRAGFGWMEMIEVYGSLIFLIIGCMAVLSGGI